MVAARRVIWDEVFGCKPLAHRVQNSAYRPSREPRAFMAWGFF